MGTKRVVTNSMVQEVLLQQVFDDFQIMNRIRNLSPATITGYKEGFKRFYLIVGKNIYCKTVTQKTIDMFITKLFEDGLKASSINHYLRGLRSFLYWCMNEKYIHPFKIRLLKEPEPIKPTYSDEQIRLLVREPLKNASFVEWRCWAMTCWFLATGNRAETACSILIKDVSLSAREVYVNKTKSNQAVILPLSTELIQVLKKYMSIFRFNESETSYLFCNVGNKKLTVNALKICMIQYNQNRGVSMTGIHALRHTFAKNWIRNNGDVFRLQKILGHKTLEMTKRYVNMFGEDLKQDYEMYCPLDRIKNIGNAKKTVVRNKHENN